MFSVPIQHQEGEGLVSIADLGNLTKEYLLVVYLLNFFFYSEGVNCKMSLLSTPCHRSFICLRLVVCFFLYTITICVCKLSTVMTEIFPWLLLMMYHCVDSA